MPTPKPTAPPTRCLPWWEAWHALTTPTWPTDAKQVRTLQRLVTTTTQRTDWSMRDALALYEELIEKDQSLWPTIWSDCARPGSWERLAMFFANTAPTLFPNNDLPYAARMLERMPYAATIVMSALLHQRTDWSDTKETDHLQSPACSGFADLLEAVSPSTRTSMAPHLWNFVNGSDKSLRDLTHQDIKRLLTILWPHMPKDKDSQVKNISQAIVGGHGDWVQAHWDKHPPHDVPQQVRTRWAQDILSAVGIQNPALTHHVFRATPEHLRGEMLEMVASRSNDSCMEHVSAALAHVDSVTGSMLTSIVTGPAALVRAALDKPLRPPSLRDGLLVTCLLAPEKTSSVLDNCHTQDLYDVLVDPSTTGTLQSGAINDERWTQMLEEAFARLPDAQKHTASAHMPPTVAQLPAIQSWVLGQAVDTTADRAGRAIKM